MKYLIPIGAALLASACTMEEPAASPADRALLAAELEGRVAGDPQNCVPLRRLGGNRSIGEGVILFEGVGDTVYVNRPPAGCPEIRPGRTLVVRTPTTQLCAGEIVNVVDPVSDTHFGGCGLGQFVPYRRVR